jgi:hypothetical protein
MSKKRKNRINEGEALELLRRGYNLDARKYNFYQFRIRYVEIEDFYDWYHTTGSLVVTRKGFPKKLGEITDPEDVAIFIKEDIYKHQ